jgi:hypothetical protein
MRSRVVRPIAVVGGVLVCMVHLSAQERPLAAGTRVRVHTVPYTLDLPGVRLEPTQITGAVLSQDADTVTVQLTNGSARTLPKANRRIVGVLIADEETLFLRRMDASPVSIPREAIGQLERFAGRGSRGRNAAWSLLVGAAIGSVLGASSGSCQGAGIGPCFGPATTAAALAGFGGGVGAAVGSIAPGRERWREVPLRPVSHP